MTSLSLITLRDSYINRAKNRLNPNFVGPEVPTKILTHQMTMVEVDIRMERNN